MAVWRNGRVTPLVIPGYSLGVNGGQVFYLDSGGVRDGYSDGISTNLFFTLASALAACRANRGDVIVAMPQHSESVTATSPTFVAGVTLLGMGNGDERPTFNWTLTGSQWSIAVANFAVANCILNFAATAATTVTKAITIAGAKSAIRECAINMGTSSTQLVTTGIEYTTGADRGVIDGCDILSAATAANVACIKLTNAVDQMRITNNVINVGMSATTAGVVTMTVAPTNLLIKGNEITNSIASSTKALVGITAATGQVSSNNLYITNATGGASAIGTLGSLGFAQNFGCATNGSAILTPAAGG